MPILKIKMKKEDTANNNFGVASVILALVAISICFLIIPPFILAGFGLVFGLIQRKISNNKWAIWGIILSLLAILLTILVIYFLSSVMNQLNNTIQQCLADPTLPGCEEIFNTLQQQNAASQ